MYLSGATNDRIEARLIELGLGLMLNPGSGYRPEQVARYPAFACDNGCFSQGDRFNADKWLRWLARFTPQAATCLFAVLPDVFGDGPATLARSEPFIEPVRALGLPVALVLQPGMTSADVPWDRIQALFTGGPNEWQRSQAVADLVDEAKRRGLWCHRGRVNSRRRFVASAVAGYDSADGTYVAFGPDVLTERVATWIAAARQPRLW